MLWNVEQKKNIRKEQLTDKMLPTDVDWAGSRLQTECERGSDFKTT